MKPEEIQEAVAPALGEPLGIEFGNTRYAVRGDVHEGLDRPGRLAGWLRAHAAAFDDGLAEAAVRDLAEADLGRFVALRDAIRALARQAVNGAVPPARALEESSAGASAESSAGAFAESSVGPLAVVNAAAAGAPRWPRLALVPPMVVEETAAPAVDAALAAIARSAIEILGGPHRAELRACGGPGCVLFFVKQHPRREWCSPGCGNRARVSRHYERHRASR
ncbi:CGNR zinc finger domain-containing protein [Spirillospora sp. NPDC048911]|uniref:CGNR zinc finger domain-containing protein n=1 Tax=Spirillospora sp. NPDC048911 TaxID=3364527 RepID=UPI003721D845